MQSTTNLALNKPALQSSVSYWSSSVDPAGDAVGGNDGDLSKDFGFHTDAERDPWWQVDLEAVCVVERVCIFNRMGQYERLRRFSVLGSFDGASWDLIASKSDDLVFGLDGEPFVLDLPPGSTMRFLRLRTDGRTCLHIRECQVFGTRLGPDEVQPAVADRTEPKRFVFSALYNETEEFFGAYLRNFLHFTDANAFLIVNLPPGRSIETDVVDDRVIVFNGDTRRHKSGHTLLLGHLETYTFALQTLGHFDYFSPLASNSLFVRRFDPAATILAVRAGHKTPIDLDIEYDIGVEIDRLPANWHWPKIQRNKPFADFLKNEWGLTRLSQNQIEGLVASSADWGLIHARMGDFPRIGEFIDLAEHAFLPLEEILPVSFFLTFGSARYTNICHVFWHRFNQAGGGGRVTPDDLLTFSRTYPAHVCVMKWFERTLGAIETAAVTQPWSQALLASLNDRTSVSRTGYRLVQRLLLERVVSSLRAAETVLPFGAGWRSTPQDVLQPCMFRYRSLRSVRTRLFLQTRTPQAVELTEEQSDAYVYMENTEHELNVSVLVEHGATTQIKLRCAMPMTDSDANSGALEGYLYLRTLQRDGSVVIRLRTRTKDLGQARAMRNVVLAWDGNYERNVAVHEIADGAHTEYFFLGDRATTDQSVWFGIPFYGNTDFEAELDVIYNQADLPSGRLRDDS